MSMVVRKDYLKNNTFRDETTNSQNKVLDYFRTKNRREDKTWIYHRRIVIAFDSLYTSLTNGWNYLAGHQLI